MPALTGPGQYAVLATALSPDVAQQISDLDLPGIYTQATTAAAVPRAGRPRPTSSAPCTPTAPARPASRREYNSLLAGKDGSITYSVDNLGNVNPSSRTVTDPARNGGTVG